MRKLVLVLMLSLAANSFAFEIIGIGSSGMNCKGVSHSEKFTTQLDVLLKSDGIDSTVINSGVDGDRSVFMYNRLMGQITPNTKLVIYRATGNDKSSYVMKEGSAKILAKMQELNIPTIFISNVFVPNDEWEELAKKYNAYHYGSATKNIPTTSEYWQGDSQHTNGFELGHMTGAGCTLWAKNMLPLVEQVIKTHNIK